MTQFRVAYDIRPGDIIIYDPVFRAIAPWGGEPRIAHLVGRAKLAYTAGDTASLAYDPARFTGDTAPAEFVAELALALEVANTCNRNGIRWGQSSPFQNIVTRLLAAVGRAPTAPEDTP